MAEDAEVIEDTETVTLPEEQKQEESQGEQQEELPKEPALTDGQQKIFNEAIGSKVKLYRDEQRKNQDLVQQIDGLKSRIPVNSRPVVPDIPDQYAEDFQELMAIRDKAISSAVVFDANEKAVSEQNLQIQQGFQKDQNEKIRTANTNYYDRANKLGIDANDLGKAGSDLAQSGLNLAVQSYLLDQPTGPQVILYLSKNPVEADNLMNMGVMDAVAHIATNLTKKASELFKPAGKTPAPADTFRGNGAKEGQRGPKGAIFE